MKITQLEISHTSRVMFTVAASILMFTSSSHAEMRDVMTQEQLIKKRSQMAQLDPMKNMVVVESKEDPAKSIPRDLISQSDVISFGGISTLVPKHAILLIPKNHASRVAYVEGNPLVSWLDFYTKNRGWITTVEVSFAQAKGEAPLSEAVSKQIAKTGNIVIATFSGGPISMLAPKTPSLSMNP